MWNTCYEDRIKDTEQTNRTIGGDNTKWGFCFVTDWCKLHAFAMGGCSRMVGGPSWVTKNLDPPFAVITIAIFIYFGCFCFCFCLFLFLTSIVYHHHHPHFAGITIEIVIHIRWTNLLLLFLFLYTVFQYHHRPHHDPCTSCGRIWILWICCILHKRIVFCPYVCSTWVDVCGIYRAAKLAAQEGRKYNTSPKKQLTNTQFSCYHRKIMGPRKISWFEMLYGLLRHLLL